MFSDLCERQIVTVSDAEILALELARVTERP